MLSDFVLQLCSRRFSCIALLVSMSVIGLTGCEKEAAGPVSSPIDSDTAVVATVNGVNIGQNEMYSEMEQYVPAQLQNFPTNAMLEWPAGRVALQHLITNELTIQLAKEQQVPVTDDEVAARYADIKMVKEAESVSSFEDLLKNQGLTVQEFEDENIKPEVAQFNVLSKGISVTDQEIRANYNLHVSDYTEPARVHIERIVLPDEAAAEKAYETASKNNSLDDVLSENIAQPIVGGENAADIPQWISIDQPGAGLRDVLQTAQGAQPGTILKPILVKNQWWLVKLVDHKNKTVMPFDKVKHIVQWNVTDSKASLAGNFQKVQAAMLDITQRAVIHVPPQYSSMVVQLKTPPTVPSASMPPTSPSN
jgi:foldase protein PrsA